jgi:CDP-glucose 4,6-dehydratase
LDLTLNPKKTLPLPDAAFWRGRRVFLTGHTGFVGGWTALWLHRMGAIVTGFALPAASEPSFFAATGLSPRLAASIIGDVRDRDAVAAATAIAKPEIVLHLAAQPLVRAAYHDPVGTFATNVMGTVHLLEAVRACADVSAILVFTTDKVYRNLNWPWPYREVDALGGDEPYSGSKSGAELATEAYRNSYFKRGDRPVPVLTVRAGNIIGGGDWAQDRIVPDAIRAFSAGRPLIIRNPAAVRPWQHVLDAVRGLLLLAERTAKRALPPEIESWNLGPGDAETTPVSALVERLVADWGEGAVWQHQGDKTVKEANYLTLDSHRAARHLGWSPAWPVAASVRHSVQWYRAFFRGEDMHAASIAEIDEYAADIAEAVGS